MKKHFIRKELSRKISLITNLVSFGVFLLLLILFTKELGSLAVYVYIMLFGIMAGVLLGYRSVSLHQKRNMFLVVFSRLNNKEIWNKQLKESNIHNIEVDGSFSFVTNIKHSKSSDEEIKKIHEVYEQDTSLFEPFNTIRAYLIFIFNVSMLSISFVCFILFFILVQAI